MSDPEFERFSPEIKEDGIGEHFEDIVDGDERIYNENIDDKYRTHTENKKDGVEDKEEEEEEEEVKDEEIEEIIHRNIFLQTNENLYAPYTAHCLLLGKATVLVILSQVLVFIFLHNLTSFIIKILEMY